MKDLGHFAKNIESIIGKAAVDVQNAINSAVFYKVNGNARINSSGISFYCNLYDDLDNYNRYAKGSNSAEYLAFLDAISHTWNAPRWVYEKTPKVKSLNFSDHILQYSDEITEDSNYRINLSNGKNSVYTVDYYLLDVDEDGGAIRYFTDVRTSVNEDWSVYDMEVGINTLMIEGIPVFAEVVNAYQDNVIYFIPIMLNDEEMSLRVNYYIKEDRYEVLGAWKGLIYDDMVSSRFFTKLEEGDVIEFLLPKIYNTFTFKDGIYYHSSGSLTFSGDMKFSEGVIPDGEYQFFDGIVNVVGRQYNTTPVSVSVKNGEIVSITAQGDEGSYTEEEMTESDSEVA